MRWFAAWVCAFTIPAWAAAQGLSLAPPDLGRALRLLDHPERRGSPLGQTVVLPVRPGQNQVAWYGFEWHTYEIPPPGGGPGGIRLYYYGRERQVVEWALPVIRDAYARLVDLFHYRPTRTVPYILYSSQREFQTTNVFDISEAVLGVTSPADLKMSLPYFGDHEKFREVSTHELVHQFTIQKLLDIAGGEQLSSSIVEALPLWFVEGIAEYYAKGGMDPETDSFLRDLVWNPDPEKHYQIVSFADDRYRGYVPTYKMGQARLAFVAEVYGKEKIQSFVENAYLLPESLGSSAEERGFAALTRRVLNEPLDQVDARWHEWLRRRYYPEYMRARQDLAEVRDIHELPAEPDAFVASADGRILFFRGIDRERGRASLYLTDARAPSQAIEVATDSVPGVESLHPVDHNVLALADGKLAFAAQDGPGDTLYVQTFRHQAPGKGVPSRFELGPRREVAVLSPAGRPFLELADPVFSPDGTRIAFVGLTESGRQDIYLVAAEGGTARPLTHDPYTEKDLAWGADGIYFSSDATEHGKLNLFRIDPATGERTRLTTAPANDRFPHPGSGGTVFFSSDAGGKSDLYSLQGGRIRKLTDFATGLTSPVPSPEGRGLYAATFHRARFRVVEVGQAAWLDGQELAVGPPAGPVLDIPAAELPAETPRYEPLSLRNWRPEAGFIYGGGVGGALGGEGTVIFSDLLRDHLLLVDFAIFNSLDFTQVLVLFQDRSGRVPWSVGAYHLVQPQLDRLDPNLEFFQRNFGVTGSLQFPFDRYRRAEAELSVGGVQRYCITDFKVAGPAQCGGIQTVGPEGTTAAWQSRNSGTNPILTPVLRFGYDTVRYDMHTGPIGGTSASFELGGNLLPTRPAVNGFARVDAAHWWRLIGRSNFMLRLAAGTSFAPNEAGATWERSWWLSSADNLRGFSPFDVTFLVGQNYYVTNAELQIPLDFMLHLFIFDYVEGVAAVDFGGVFNRFEGQRQTACDASGSNCAQVTSLGAWQSRTLTGVLGFNFLLGPFLFRLHFGHPFDIGGELTPALANHLAWVTNFSLRYFFL